jgi:Xaa-Pro aminopeptidase
MQAFAILHDDARLDLFIDASKLGDIAFDNVTLHPPEAFASALRGSTARSASTPPPPRWPSRGRWRRACPAPIPAFMPKARKTEAELGGMRAAHLRDGAAMAEFLRWFDTVALHRPSEIELAMKLEECRQATGELLDLSFETISGAGPNGAIVHYRVTEETNRRLEPGELYLVDSGGQYADGTTDITRTLPAGDPPAEARAAYTRVLQGMIAISRARFPQGRRRRASRCAGALSAVAHAGADYDHGTGHGVGAALSVHEGPVRLSRVSTLPLEEGMILSNEPGYYRAGAFGIRIENLVAIRAAPDMGEGRKMLEFETLTLAPIDTRLIDRDLMTGAELDWLNAYHDRVEAALSPLVSPETRDWLARACAPI